MHGHRYRWEAVIEGDIIQESGVSDEGMLMDFSDISEILTKYIHDVVDHSFIVYENDEMAINASPRDSHRTLIVPFIPTAENLAKWAFEQVEPRIKSKYGQRIQLVAMNVRETPVLGVMDKRLVFVRNNLFPNIWIIGKVFKSNICCV